MSKSTPPIPNALDPAVKAFIETQTQRIRELVVERDNARDNVARQAATIVDLQVALGQDEDRVGVINDLRAEIKRQHAIMDDWRAQRAEAAEHTADRQAEIAALSVALSAARDTIAHQAIERYEMLLDAAQPQREARS